MRSMYFSFVAHKLSVRGKRAAHGSTLVFPWVATGLGVDCSWVTLEFPTSCPCVVHGKPVDCPWCARELPVGSSYVANGLPWVAHG